jgi:Vacuolar protein sorting-associated protein 62
VRRSFASVLLIVVCALAVAGSAAGEPERAPSLAALLARHVPVLVLHPDESFQPVSVDGFLADSDLTRKTAAGWEPVPGPLPAGGADLRLDQRLCTAFDGLAATSCYVSAEAAHGAAPVVYGAVFRTRDRIDLQYWLWYPYDDFSPAYPATDFWEVHEGDWEAVSVILDRAGAPLTVAYSQHRKGRRRAWALTPKRGLRPLVYVALGSHANFPSPGEHPLVPPAVDQATINVMRAYGIAQPADHTAKGTVIRPALVRVTSRTPSWMTFAGAWGESGYVHIPGRDPLVAGAGPRGPTFHPQWQRPVREEMSWPRG